ncbi:hypothetical protein E2C01_079326 [Portunus trituberculatus]|uniref:Uncharacterized protein n=1 Tax=Portunus trituberculatus TaxID=210409 RepID=A0A5B7IWL9_PORTR|nr:hypothetical protein [Portunus trituberculatus]
MIGSGMSGCRLLISRQAGGGKVERVNRRLGDDARCLGTQISPSITSNNYRHQSSRTYPHTHTPISLPSSSPPPPPPLKSRNHKLMIPTDNLGPGESCRRHLCLN